MASILSSGQRRRSNFRPSPHEPESHVHAIEPWAVVRCSNPIHYYHVARRLANRGAHHQYPMRQKTAPPIMLGRNAKDPRKGLVIMIPFRRVIHKQMKKPPPRCPLFNIIGVYVRKRSLVNKTFRIRERSFFFFVARPMLVQSFVPCSVSELTGFLDAE